MVKHSPILFKLVGLDLLTDLNGYDFKKLDKSLQRKLRNSTLRSLSFRAAQILAFILLCLRGLIRVALS
ncbi:hypothetical protein QQ73_09700, partial [Candidatus Endoriftia persephone str. Guaymas]|nr:hypothetical protein [Candidatus Endoriftia persephone str. Guaymas]